jgi:hypothetical protein
MRIPSRPARFGELLKWAADVSEYLSRMRVLSSPDVKPVEGTKGTMLLSTTKNKGGSSENVWQ